MYFKSLELVGFKSFAEKTKLNFEPGVTAVVGPNGCGKSNIADSIRWVLGEQSAKSLRASNMQDVIFNGTDNKEPINYAEVSLTFSNEKRTLPIDYDEVTITRRIFRSGDTEYLLNKTPVRLKDISELLMGTGIGTESYSIIEQGKMDLILSSRPEDRRYVFEEASGITKYKSKKKEALRKLEQTEQNLLRINDIILEVKRQISSIERQARKAERYKVDFDKLKELETKLSFSEYKNLKTQEATIQFENEDAKSREKELDAEVRSMASVISGYRQSLDGLNQKISDLKNKHASSSNSLNMNVHKIDVDKERIAETITLQESLKKEIESVSEKINSARSMLEILKTDLGKVSSERLAKQTAIESKELLLASLSKEMDEIENSVKVNKIQIVDHLAAETRIKNELIKMGADVQNRRIRQRRLATEKETVVRDMGDLGNVLDNVTKEFKGAEDKLISLRTNLDGRKKTNDELSSELKALEESIIREENRRTAISSKIEVLEDNVRRYEGFSRGVKSLLAEAHDGHAKSSGIIGVLAEMIKVERGYEEAINSFLNSNSQVIITERDNDITMILAHLSDQKLGKASFVSLEMLGRIAKGPGPGVQSPGKELVPLRNFVKADSKYEAMLDYFFKDAYLIDSIEECMKNTDSSSAVFVTKAGYMYDNGRISGGSTSDSDESLLIGRRDRLEDLKSELKRVEERVVSLGVCRGQKYDANKVLTSEIFSLEENLRAEEIAFANIKVKKDSQDADAKRLKEESELLDSELAEVEESIIELTTRGETLNLELNNIEKEKSFTENFINESQVIISDKRSEREKATLEVTTLRAERQSIDREEETANKNLKNQEAIVFELEETLYSRQSVLKESADKIKAFEEEMVSLSAQNETITSGLQLLETEISSVEKNKSDFMDKLGIGEMQLKEKESSLETLRNQVRDLDVRSAELSYKKTNLRERISQAYKIDLENTHLELEDNIDWDAIKTQVAEFKERLDKIGPVNLVAIDEHKELEERNAFLIHQQEDLVNAKDSLHKAIQKINKTTKDLFLEAFQKIQVEFKNFFRLLFGGGQAELVLIDEQDILESGIEIIVRPPGKKLQNIMLLSGGEKAMTAIALLFAVFKVKPSPFCVLDEIDAPLDESNVLRFSNVLKDFIKIAQFIIITHNKRTIELADVMYGITMQERGVSKIVSVKFSHQKKEEEVVQDQKEIKAENQPNDIQPEAQPQNAS